MLFFLFIFLAGCAVKCDESYYVIQMPQFDAPREPKKPFRVYWNVPTIQCSSKKLPFEDLHEKYGIIQNKNDSFRGEKISILYDPGLFPALLKNETTGEYKARNGGVPQEGDLEKHLTSFRNVLEQSVPDPNFSGVGIIDFESWRPVFRQNFGVLKVYKEFSYQAERNRHWLWPSVWIEAEAKQRFEESARKFIQTTLSLAKQMRPNALWGYYGFPYCFNMAENNMQARCADKVPEENDSTYWLWSESTALYPSVYSPSTMSTYQLTQRIAGRIRESARVRRNGTPILPYFWFRYINKNAGFLTKEDLNAALKTLYQSAASGIIIWGSSNDVNTVEKCIKLHKYVEETLGPAIAQYTRHDDKTNPVNDAVNDSSTEINFNNITNTTAETNINNTTDTTDDNTNININNITTTTTTIDPFDNETIEELTTIPINGTDITSTTMESIVNELDIESHYDSSSNYTKEVIEYVEEEFSRKTDNQLTNDTLNTTAVKQLNQSALIDLIIDTIIDDMIRKKTSESTVENESISYSKNDKKGYAITKKDILTTTINYETSTDKTDNYDLKILSNYNTAPSNLMINKNMKKGKPHSNFNTDTKTNVEDVNNQGTTSFSTYKPDHTTVYEYTEILEANDPINNFYNQETLYEPKENYTTYNSIIETTTSIDVKGNETDSIVIEIIETFTEKPVEDFNITEDTALFLSVTENLFTTAKNYEVTETSTNVDYVEHTQTFFKFNQKNSKKGLPRSTTESDIKTSRSTLENLTTSSALEQVAGMASSNARVQYYLSIFIYFSVSKCLYEIY